MNKKDAQNFLGLVNLKANTDDLSTYADYRVQILKDRLASAKSWDEVQRIQGAIDEVTRLKTLRDEVLNPRDI